MIQTIDTLIIGAGQGGLATSYYLKQNGREHLILEQSDQAGSVWRDGRWDSFTLVTPNWAFLLPGVEYQGSDPGGFLPRDEVVRILTNYPAQFQLPLRTNTQVKAVEAHPDGGFYVHTDDTLYHANNVVMATGLFQTPRVPSCGAQLPEHITQVHSAHYRNPEQLPQGGVLVVGSSQSGCQIAEEIHQSGRPAFLCVGEAGRIPRRYRGKDIMEWTTLLGVSERTVDMLPSPKAKFAPNPQMSGKADERGLNLHLFAQQGIQLLGRLEGISNGKAQLAADLHANLAFADKFEANLLAAIDAYIAKTGLEQPAETLEPLIDGYAVEQLSELDLAAHNIQSVVWAVGYNFDFGLVKLPIFDEDGYPIHKRGATQHPGLYFVGLPWLHKQKSGLLSGVGEDAAYIAQHICANNLCAA